MGYIFIFIRVIILPFILFKIFRDKLKNPFWDINILVPPIMWAIFYLFHNYEAITWICAGVGFLIFFILCCLSYIRNNMLLKNAQTYIIITLFELFSLYIPSVIYSSSLFYSGPGEIYLLWIKLFTVD